MTATCSDENESLLPARHMDTTMHGITRVVIPQGSWHSCMGNTRSFHARCPQASFRRSDWWAGLCHLPWSPVHPRSLPRNHTEPHSTVAVHLLTLHHVTRHTKTTHTKSWRKSVEESQRFRESAVTNCPLPLNWDLHNSFVTHHHLSLVRRKDSLTMTGEQRGRLLHIYAPAHYTLFTKLVYLSLIPD